MACFDFYEQLIVLNIQLLLELVTEPCFQAEGRRFFVWNLSPGKSFWHAIEILQSDSFRFVGFRQQKSCQAIAWQPADSSSVENYSP